MSERIVAHLHSGDHVLLIGHHGSGKSRHTELALQKYAETSSGVVVSSIGPTSRSSTDELLRQLEMASVEKPAILIVDRPARLSDKVLEVLQSVVPSGTVRMIIETESRRALPQSLQSVLHGIRYSTVQLEPPTAAEAREWLSERLGGPVPAGTANYVWRATGGNPELLGILTGAALECGLWVRGEYAWRWTASIDAPLADIPEEVIQHVDRQFYALASAQQWFLARLTLCGAIDARHSASFIDDTLLAELEHGGFIRRCKRRDGALVFQLRAPIFGWSLDRNMQPGFIGAVFASLESPVRGREDPIAVLAWTRLAMRAGVRLSAEQVEYGNEAAFSLMRWNHIEESVDALVPANPLESEVVDWVLSHDLEEQQWIVLNIMQRALSYHYRDLPSRAQADMRIVHSVIDREPRALGQAAYHLMQLDVSLAESVTGTLALDEAFDRNIGYASDAGDEFLVENFGVWRMSYRNEDVMDRMPLSEFEHLIDAHLGVTPFAVAVAPHLGLRQAFAGRFADALATFDRVLSLRELRVTDLPANPHSHSLAWNAVLRGYSFVLIGKVDEAFVPLRDELTRTMIDPPAAELLVSAARIARGQWDLAYHSLSAVLETLKEHDHNLAMKKALAMFSIVCAARGDAPGSIAALHGYDAIPLRRNSIFESMLEYWALVASAALGRPHFSERLDAYIARFSAAGEWFAVLRAAHLGAAVVTRERREPYLDILQQAAAHVDSDIAEKFVHDGVAMANGDEALIAATRAELSTLGVWIPQQQTEVVLSRRQREIAGLVVAGLANKEIAERLHVSVRTVESHVAAVLGKFGITDRRLLVTRLAMVT